MKKTTLVFAIIITLISFPLDTFAQPYGTGKYDENVPYGDATSLSIATSGNVNVSVTPTTTGILATGTSGVTVSTTDVKGFKLYIRSLTSTDMDNLGSLIPASANGTPAALANNTWGYNTDGSSNFVGMTLSDVLIRTLNTPASSGDLTTVTYGVKLDLAKPAGNYTTTVIYTAVPQTF